VRTDSTRMPRRSFLAALGFAAGGLSIGAFDGSAAAGEAAPAPKTGDGLRPNVFVHVATDGWVTIVCHRSEMGQGVRSSLPVLIADELGADMARVKIAQADGDKAYGDQNTDGSSSVRKLYDDLRRVGATARVMLVAAAAKRWGVPASSCVARDHAVFHEATGRSIGFGLLADAAARLPVPRPEDAPLRPESELRRVGGLLPLVDAPDIVTGRAVFGADVRLPGMLIAVIARPPVVGGRVSRFDPAPALAVPGVRRVVELPAPRPPFAFQALGGVAVLADGTWAAMKGRAALHVEWEDGPNGAYDSARFRDELFAAVRSPGRVVRRIGDVDGALASAARTVEAEYYVPHLAHAPMEPPVALATVTADACEVWTSTQEPQAARREAARALGIDESRVTVHVTLLGGAFGRKSPADFVSEAVLLSRAAGAPVRVQWTREDDVRHDYYHAVSAQRLTAGLDPSGRVVAWLHRSAFPPIGSTFRETARADDGELQQGILDLPLAIPNVRAENGEAKAHVRIGWLRSVCNIQHAFAVNSFVDEIAQARGADPRDVLLEVLGPPRIVGAAELGVDKVPNYGASLDRHPIDVGRLRRVVERATELARWSDRRREGRSLGLAAHRSFLTYVAAVVSVTPESDGKIRVDEAWVVADAGKVVNLERVRAQLEGAAVFGTSIALHGAITVKNGAVEQSNFRDYRVARIREAPRKTHVEVVRSESPPGGVGEPGVPPIAPAIANAVFALTGRRVRELPLSRCGLA